MGSSKAPPQLLVLLWHHFTFYKRHWVQLIITVVLPVPLLLSVYAILASNPGKSLGLVVSERCWSPTKSSLSSGPLPFMLSDMCYSKRRPSRECSEDFSSYSEATELERGLASPPGQLFCFDSSATDRPCLNVKSTAYGLFSKDWIIKIDENSGVCKSATEQLVDGPEWRAGCVLLRHNIAFFPNTSASANKVMEKVAKRLESMGAFFAAVPGSGELPGEAGLVRSVLSYARLLRNCAVGPQAVPAPTRIKGFRSKQDFIAYTSSISYDANSSNSAYGNVVPDLWGGVAFEGGLEDLHYSLVYDALAEQKKGRELLWLQDLVDGAVLDARGGGAEKVSGWARRELGADCSSQPNRVVYQIFAFLLPLLILIAFILPHVNFTTQVLTEKELKLREYLYIMGVGRLRLKASWVLFYQIWIIPMCFLVAGILKGFPGLMFAETDYMVLVVTLVLYNAATSCWCLLLAACLNGPRRTTLLLVFKTLVEWIIFAFVLRNLDLEGYKKGVAVVFSLLSPGTPLCLAMAYVLRWEQTWIGQDWWNLGGSPVPADGFGGLGSVWAVFVGTSALWLLLTWYIEQVAPGDFGVRQPFYFPFLPSYWCPARAQGSYQTQTDGAGSWKADVEEADGGSQPGIQLSGLTKMYSADRVGVADLDLTFYRDSVTAFLGKNGAGKSTTINILVGLISPSDGHATVLGMDIQNEMDAIRREVGFVPQYDILYPDMTVQEHLKFFGWLKGLSAAETKAWTEGQLKKLGMEHLLKNVCTTLSGGQKRKLSVLTAYLGSPKVVILDEPTSGVDPFSRRGIWEMVLGWRRSATTLISTHFMEEADLLGERIAIISQGRLVATGSPMYLKNRYGGGFKIIVACQAQLPATARVAIRNFFEEKMPESKCLGEKGSDVTFGFPNEVARSEEMVGFLRELEKAQGSLGIASYGIAEPSLEEVFFNSTDSAAGKAAVGGGSLTETADGVQLVRTGAEVEAGDGLGEAGETSDQIHYTKHHNSPAHIASQIVGVAYKKLLYTVFSPAAWVLQILLPLVFIGLLLLIGNAASSTGKEVQLGIWQSFKTNKFFFVAPDDGLNPFIESAVKQGLPLRCPSGFDGFSCGSAASSVAAELLADPAQTTFGPDTRVCTNSSRSANHPPSHEALGQPNAKTPSGDVVYRVGSGSEVGLWTLLANETRSPVVGGLQRRTLDQAQWNDFLRKLEAAVPGREGAAWVAKVRSSTPLDVNVLWHGPDDAAALSNVLTNLRLRLLGKEGGVRTTWTAESLLGDSSIWAVLRSIYDIYFSFIFVACCFAFGTFGIAVLVQEECSSGLKRMQMLMGCHPAVYWGVNFVGDFLLYMVTVAVVLIVLSIFPNGFSKHIATLASLVIPYGFMAISFTYLASFLFRGTKGIVVFTVVSFVFVLIQASIFSLLEVFHGACEKGLVVKTEGACPFGWAPLLGTVFRLIPAYFIVDGLNLIVFTEVFAKVFGGDGGKVIPLDKLLGDLNSFDMLGKRILTAVIAGVVYLVLCVVLEILDARLSCGACSKGPKNFQAASPLVVRDPDVAAEEERVLGQAGLDEPLVLRNVSKTYPGAVLPAVAGVTVGIPGGQCFGLLGINGAGKSTLFKMLTGTLGASGGEAWLGGRSLLGSRGWARLRNTSYCPQENTLFSALSVAQHLELFGRLRGVPGRERGRLAACLLAETGLGGQADKRAGQLSGGNQRKLQLALALLDYPAVVLLDEPTTGMDPGARRAAWAAVSRAVGRGSALVLTSHSMEECEQLCDRLVIMVAGTFHCLGSVQYLKGKFGNQYHFQLKLPSPASPAPVRAAVAEAVPRAVLAEHNATMLHYEVGAAEVVLSELFALLSRLRSQRLLEDFSVNQTNLERAFVKMAAVQERLQAGLAPEDQPKPDDPPSFLPPISNTQNN